MKLCAPGVTSAKENTLVALRPAVRLYFHLVDTHEVIRDLEGIEVDDLEHARFEALRAVREVQKESGPDAGDWLGWTLNVTDAKGLVVFSLDLDGRAH